jgi:deazaflavin-dependent oxidoreductase (nitroreductase family)
LTEKIRDIHPPRGIFRWLARLPIWLYHLRLGWVLGDRFLLLTHIGRLSGLPRQVVLEVVQHNKDTGVYYVAVGFGEKSDWYRNILKTPGVKVCTGRRQWAARANKASPELAEQVILDYARRHPIAIRELVHILGYKVDGTQADYAALGRILPIIALLPVNISR